jgi:hypothetical protein
MSESIYINHPLRASVTQILSLLQSEKLSDPIAIGSNEEYAFARDKIFAICKLLEDNLKRTPATLASVHGLNLIQSQLQAVISELATFQSDNNPAHLVTAVNVIDQAVAQQMWAFLPSSQQNSEPVIANAATEFRESAFRSISKLVADELTLKTEISTHRSEIVRQNDLLKEMTETIAKQKADALSVVSQVKAEYAEKESIRITEFTSALEGFKNSFTAFENQSKSERDKLILSITNEFGGIAKNTKEQRDVLIESLRQSENETARIVELVGNNAITGKFQVTANKESTQANLWRNITIGIFGFGLLIAASTFVKFLFEPFTPESAWGAAIRLMYAIAITAPAWYTAKESARHRTNADRARQIELELTSLGPFIETMDDTKKIAIRESLIGKYFGREVEAHTVAEPISLKDVKDLVIETVKAVKH